ncbi:Saccharomyces cerevisiae DCR2 phosphatase [Proteiniphilum saccharofermentans]|uniref:Saccharomyces cerevisiae DCR2 phosphatase n=1 Tax=Proteiniphilum saccharofermentans TaxID=1642647 RepID=A0A1R3SU90_9BACT|nr:metallophosphoesterase family protein [Proteiniphilum saccharofermentans]SCD19896.1 Saccharomyces cerevisiae DCR2 phosphatase [Proteiniphilum saccharofermentans]SEA19955.1 Calcineurin-like phosphoesterase [Porphyromonadaceae bacterium KH3R12]SFS75347.1 Calcineurin-like phosphoesterase [Porphyromonadaceae bacterium NLAE-zl-C104]
MNKKLIIILLLGVFTFSLNAQKLSFKKDGTFKIVQFTDMHYKHGDPKSDTTLMLIPRILDTEKPDMVIFTGDIVTGAVQEGWDAVTKFVIDRKIPFAVTLGNHDHEQGVTREEIADIVTSYPFNINRLSEISHGRVMDNVIPVYSSLKPLKEAALIYCFDTGAYSTIDGVGGYDWMTTKQIEWYREQSIHYTVKNNFHPLPALAYFHIPLPEYKLAFDDEKNIRYGERKEDECPPGLNSGMFFSMKEMGDIMGTFVGHDHVNDYIVNYHGIALTYGHFSGWKTTYTPEINGARIVVLKEGKREFDTWLHQLDGNIKHKVSYPSQLLNPAK